MKKILLRFYAANNLGDDLFVKILTDRYVNTFSIISRDSNISFDKIKNLHVYRNPFIYFVLRTIGKVLGLNNLHIRLLQRKNDLLVYVGGSIFIEGPHLSMWQKEESFYLTSPTPYYILGSNFGPYKSSEFVDLSRSIMKNAVDVCFRDDASYSLFKDLKTTRSSTDLAFSLDTSKYQRNSEKSAILSLINCHGRFDEKTADRYDQEMANLTRKLVAEGYNVILMSFCKEEGDELAVDKVWSMLEDTLVEAVTTYRYDGNLDEALNLIAKSEIVAASRFHAAILGLLFKKKILPIAYSDKTLNILKDMDFEGDIVDIRKIDEFDGSSVAFDTIPKTNIDALSELAEKQFAELDKVLIRKNG